MNELPYRHDSICLHLNYVEFASCSEGIVVPVGGKLPLLMGSTTSLKTFNNKLYLMCPFSQKKIKKEDLGLIRTQWMANNGFKSESWSDSDLSGWQALEFSPNLSLIRT